MADLDAAVAALPAKLEQRHDREIYLTELSALEMQDLKAAGIWEKGTAQQAHERLTAQHATLRNLAKQRVQERKADVQSLAL